MCQRFLIYLVTIYNGNKSKQVQDAIQLVTDRLERLPAFLYNKIVNQIEEQAYTSLSAEFSPQNLLPGAFQSGF